MKALGLPWAVLGTLFFIIVFGVVFKSALGSSWIGFWFDFSRFRKDFWRVLEEFWECWESSLERFFLGFCLLFLSFCLLSLASCGTDFELEL